MANPAIRVTGLGKRYRLGHAPAADRFSELLQNGAAKLWRAPSRWLAKRGLPSASNAEKDGDFWALRDVSFEVPQGEVVGIIGRNGAGKSTLLKILSRITEPTAGRVEIRGRIGSLLEVGTGFHPELSGRENIYLNGALLGMRRSEIKRKFDEIVAFSEIEQFLDTPVKRYSSGMYVRLAFAVAAHLEPEILVVDEVLAVGDAAFQKKCLGKLGQVAGQGRTVLFVSHNLHALRSLCQTAIWLEQGGLRRQGTTEAVVADYLSAQSTEGSFQKTGEKAAQAPTGGHVRLTRVRAVPARFEQGEAFHLDRPFRIEIEFENQIGDRDLHVTYHLLTDDGIVVLSTNNQPQRYPLGTFRWAAVIPANLLNERGYAVRVFIVQDHGQVLLRVDDAIAFRIAEAARELDWFGDWPGVVRPRIEWQAILTEDDACRNPSPM